MDDTILATTTHIQTRWVLSALEDSVAWKRMKIKPYESRYPVLRKGRVNRLFKVQVRRM